MTNIIERLKTFANRRYWSLASAKEQSALFTEAAVEIERLRAALAEVDGVIEEYGIDTVGTGPCPSKKEQARVDAIVDAASERHRARAALPPETKP